MLRGWRREGEEYLNGKRKARKKTEVRRVEEEEISEWDGRRKQCKIGFGGSGWKI